MKYLFILLIMIGFHVEGSSQKKQGFIVYSLTISFLPEYTLLQAELLEEKKKITDSLGIVFAHFSQFLKYETPHNSKLNEIDKKMIEDSLTSFQKKLEFIQNSFQTRIAKRSYEIDKELQYLLKNELIKYTKQNQIPWVVDKNKILYCSNCIDYTDDFIKHLKRLNP